MPSPLATTILLAALDVSIHDRNCTSEYHPQIGTNFAVRIVELRMALYITPEQTLAKWLL